MKFEDNLSSLERLVGGMESGNMGLDEMIAAFEKGRALLETCRRELESTRLKIEKVVSGEARPVGIKPDGDVDL